MFSNLNLIESNTSANNKVEDKPLPSTYEEWLQYNEYEDWPFLEDADHDSNKDIHLIDELAEMRSEREINKILKSKASCQFDILDDISNEVDELKANLEQYASYFFNFTDQTYAAERKQALTPSKNQNSASIDIKDNVFNESESVVMKNQFKSIENATFPGFFSKELTPLAGSLEAPQLLNQITKMQYFNNSFRNTWRKCFLSEPSAAILQDTFWWMVLEFHDQKSSKEVQSKFFHRIAASFVNLFLYVPYCDKDQFFIYYPNCLCQAIYSALCSAFPISFVKVSNKTFVLKLVDLVYEWVTGTKPNASSIIQDWDFKTLEFEGRQGIQDDIVTQNLLKNNIPFNEDTFLGDSPCQIMLPDDGDTFFLSNRRKSERVEKCKSYSVDTVPEYVRQAFDIHGDSPLIFHYLSSRGLMQKGAILKKAVTRTEIDESKKNKKTCHQSYLQAYKKDAKHRKDRYNSITEQLNKQCKTIERRNIEEINTLSKMHNNLLAKHANIKIMSEKIIDMIARSDFASKKLSSSIKNDCTPPDSPKSR